jgi:hypothetical protein
MFWYLIYQSKTNDRNTKRKIKQQLTSRTGEAHLHLASAQPSFPLLVFFPEHADSCVERAQRAAAPPRRREAPGPPRDPSSRHEIPSGVLLPFPLSPWSPVSSSSPFPANPSSRRSAPRAPAWPATSRSVIEVSNESAAVDFIFPRSESTPEAPAETFSSSSHRRIQWTTARNSSPPSPLRPRRRFHRT